MASGRHVAYVAQWAGWRTHQRIIAERLNAADAGKALPHPERARSRSSPTPLVIQRSGPPLSLSQARQKPANREVDGRAIATLLGLAGHGQQRSPRHIPSGGREYHVDWPAVWGSVLL